MPIDLVHVKLAAALCEVVQRGIVGGKGFRLLGKFSFFKKPGDCGCDRRVPIAGSGMTGMPLLRALSSASLRLPVGGCLLWVFADGQAYPFPFLAPLQVVGTFGMLFRLAVYEHEIRFDASVR